MDNIEQFVDGFSTSRQWQCHVGGAAVLPIGSFEQHGAHLPVATDNILAEFFAAHLAREIGGALLPTLSIFQCYEHTGFRGSFSLRPETAMAVIRDLAADLARQHFTRLVILNGHGGNFALPTVVRDINRLDGPLKVLLVDYAAHCDGSLVNFADDMHSGAWETSLFMAAAEELCGSEKAAGLVGDLDLTGEPEIPLAAANRGDLNMWGLGVLRPRGPWGDQRNSDIEYGRRIVASIKENLVNYVRQRLDWLDENPSYGGAGNIVVRQMVAADIASAMRLVDLAGWNQRPVDWQNFLDRCGAGCVVAVRNGQVVGTAVASNYHNAIGWIGMILVDPEMRRRGIATMLMGEAMELLADCQCVKLDATAAGRKVYEKLGFVGEYTITRRRCDDISDIEIPAATISCVRAMTEADLDAVIALDAEVFGSRRRDLIAQLLANAGELAAVIETDGQISGFVMGRHGRRCDYIGPLTAGDENSAIALLNYAIANCRTASVCIDIDDAKAGLADYLSQLGFGAERKFLRMCHGVNIVSGAASMQYAIAGPALG